MTPEELQALIQGNRQQSLAPRNPGGIAGIDPIILEEIARGRTAGSELAGINAQIEQLRGRKMAIPQGFSAPGVYQAASPLAFLAAFLSDSAKGKKIADLNEQAKALRGDVTIGDEAALQREQLMKQAQYDSQRELASLYRGPQGRDKLVRYHDPEDPTRILTLGLRPDGVTHYDLNTGETRDASRLEPWSGKMELEYYQDPNNPKKPITVKRDTYGRTFDLNNNRIDVSGWPKFKTPKSTPAKAISEYEQAVNLIKDVDAIDAMYNEMSKGAKEQLDSPVAEALMSIIPGEPLMRLAESKYYDKPEVKQYQTRGNRFAADLSKLMSGLAITGFELKDREKWNPFAKGTTQAEKQIRIDNIKSRLLQQIKSHHELYGTDHLKHPYSGELPTVEPMPKQEEAGIKKEAPQQALTLEQINAMSPEAALRYIEQHHPEWLNDGN